jgi:4-amino-4-deoxy-L-arabinose transferase-like glycosyltransferase
MLAPLGRWVSRLPNQVYGLLLLVASVPLLYGLGSTVMHPWDEARLAINASEMALNKQWLVTHIGGQPDLWNTKPPLMIWLQVICIWLLGNTELAIRLPSALAAFATLSLLYWFSVKTLRDVAAGTLAFLVLLTSAGYTGYHMTRTGDYDALLVFWQVLTWTSFFRYLEDGRPRDWWLVTAGLIGGTLTKSVAGLLGVPALVLYALYRRQARMHLTQRRFFGSIGLFVLLVGGYYVLREWAAPGYWQAVQHNDLYGRYTVVLSGNSGTPAFYLSYLQTQQFVPWFFFVGPAAVLLWLQPNQVQRRAAVLLVLFAGTWLLLISGSATKLRWYNGPALPALALLVGQGLACIYRALHQHYAAPVLASSASLALFVGLVFWHPYRLLIESVTTLEKRFYPEYYAYRAYLDALPTTHPGLGRFTVLSPLLFDDIVAPKPHEPTLDYNPVMQYYQLAYRTEKDLQFQLKSSRQITQLREHDTVVLCAPRLQTQLDSVFATHLLFQDGPCTTLVVGQRK